MALINSCTFVGFDGGDIRSSRREKYFSLWPPRHIMSYSSRFIFENNEAKTVGTIRIKALTPSAYH
jgi:hypothetical protein